ncbi:UNVERIFIED_ORG: hypothetical protein GGD51_003847 [Rhizobium esperanzae]|uniref:hypothetical protein n=1 Tax=Rhizobium phaseoli TaxID=396 RepID=UPI0004D397C3|nr:hypothetical protein [Rhizobium phaseoli]KEC74209.1 transmembrane protein [Rhizobium leguminosarum bv. phaseoli CCGM1]PWI53088.1 hypothetical protein B5K03_17060 [Rhizobium phaseoli]
MEDWFSYVMSFFHMALQNAVFFMATLRNALSRLDDLQFAAVVFGDLGVFVILLATLVGMSRRLRRSADAIRLLNDDLARVAQDLNVERVWRLAGGDGSERPSGDSLKELYKILARHHDDASRMA